MKTFIVAVLILIGNTSYCQKDNTGPRKVLKDYIKLIDNKKYDQAFDYYREDLLKYILKKQLNKQFAVLDQMENIEHTVENSEITYISQVLNEDSLKYCWIKYTSETHLRLGKSLDKDKSQGLGDYFKEQYPEDYSFSKSKNKIIIKKRHELIAIKDVTWKFLIYTTKLKPFMHLWLPTETMQSLLILKVAHE
ncbi:MAG: hypothetical protein AAFN93_21145 [Bacteroidota bacterium]